MPPNHTSSSVPLTQNTAPILTFKCLFTSDLKKKQKKWQDGRLKFHTFNKRIMVYDDRTNYVGDTHYHTYTLEEGEELELERGVLVQVEELIEKQDQDLGEILESVRGAGKSARQASIAPERGAGRAATPGPAAGRYTTPVPVARQMSMLSGSLVRPLSALLGTPQGHHGRALLPTTSPFEDRQNAARLASETPEPAAKRRKVDSIPSAQPLWATTSLMQSGLRKENLFHKPIAQEVSYPDSVVPKARVKKTFEKPAKPGYAQKLTGAVLDLSNTQKTNSYLGRQSSAAQGSPDGDSDEDLTIADSRAKLAGPAPILPPVKRKPAAILPPKKPAEIVYPDSIAPTAKPRKSFEKTSKAGYAEKLTGAALDLSSSNMAKVHQRGRHPIRQPFLKAPSESDDNVQVADVQDKSRVQTPILPPAARKPAPILPPKSTGQRDIVYPNSIASKPKARRTFEKKSKAGYAEKLIGAALNLSGAPAPASSTIRSLPTSEEEELMARLAELREKREASERAEAEDVDAEVPAPKRKKARTSRTKAMPVHAQHPPGKENEESLDVEDGFMDIDAIVPSLPPAKIAKPKKARASRKKKQADNELKDSTPSRGRTKSSINEPTSPVSEDMLSKSNIPISNVSQGETGAIDSLQGNSEQSDESRGTEETSQTLLSATSHSLRIKAKPKRNMLMMRPSPREPAAKSTAVAAARPAILPRASLQPQKHAHPEPSQATKDLLDFHAKQNEKLEERRRKIEARKRTPIEINSSPEPEHQAADAMDIPSSPINVEEEEWDNPNALPIKRAGRNDLPHDHSAAAVRPTPSILDQQPSATPLSPLTINRSKPFSIEESGYDFEAESEESAITYTEIDKILRPQRHGSLSSRSFTAPAGLIERPFHDDSITPPPQPSPAQSSPAFTQPRPRIKRPLPTFPSARSDLDSFEAAKSALRRPPVPLFKNTYEGEPQSSLFVGQESPQKVTEESCRAVVFVGVETIAGEGMASDEDDPSQPIRAAGRVRPAQAERQLSPDWPTDGSDSEMEAPSPLRQPKARPVVDSSDTCPESQAEEGGFASSPPPNAYGREFTAAEEEALAKGHSVLVKIKSGIRSKEIIRPKSVNQIRPGEDNTFIGFGRPPLPIIRSRRSTFITDEAGRGGETENDVDEDDIMKELELQAQEDRLRALRIAEAQRRTREFREKKEMDRIAMEKMKQAEEKRLEGERRLQEEHQRVGKMRLVEQERQMRQATEQQERESVELQVKKQAEDKQLADKLREEEENREREERRLEEELQREAAEKERQERARKKAEQQVELKRREEEEVNFKLAEEVRRTQHEEQQKSQREKDDLEAKTKLDEDARIVEIRRTIQKQMEEQMQEQVRALQEQLRLSNLKLEEQKGRERFEVERREKAELQRLTDLRIREDESRLSEESTKKMQDQSLVDHREKEAREAEQLSRKEAAEKLRQQKAVDADAAKLTSPASLMPRSLPRALVGMRADQTQVENDKIQRQAEYQQRVNTSFGTFNDANTSVEYINISDGGSFGEGDLVLAAPKVSAFKMPAPRSQAALQPQTPRPSMAPPTRSEHGFPTHIHAAMYANNILTGSHDFASTFQSTPPAQGYKVPSTLHLSAPSFKPFCKPKSVPIVAKKAQKTMKEIRDAQRGERDNREDLKRIPRWEEKGDILTWKQGAWTAEVGDLLEWKPKVGDLDDD